MIVNRLLLILELMLIEICICMFPDTKLDENCDKWAREGRCVTHASYMWSSCHTSCMLSSGDKDDRCAYWAKRGQCTKDPSFVHINCPTSCGRAIGWSPWARSAASLNLPLPYFEEFKNQIDHCMSPIDLVGAAEVISTQLIIFLNGGAQMTSQLGTNAPNEYLGMFGLTEGLIYALVLYSFNIRFVIEKLNTLSDETIGVSDAIDNAELRNKRLSQLFQDISNAVRTDYNADALMRNLPTWQNVLHTASGDANLILDDYRKYFPIKYDIPVDTCPYPRGPLIQEIDELMENLKSTKTYTVQSTLRLWNGMEMPSLGFGTFQLPPDQCEEIVLKAIKIGYRLIDTADIFGTEICVGWALKSAIEQDIVKRSDMFIITKISDDRHATYLEIQHYIEKQLEKLKTNYIDLYMLNGPLENQLEAWKALEDLVDRGLIRSIGISNFEEIDLNHLLSFVRIKPVVIQNKVDIYHVGKQIDDIGDNIMGLARMNSMIVQGYSPFSGFPFVLLPLQDPIVKYIAKRRHITPAQVILRWILQHGMATIPRTSDPKKMQENYDTLTIAPLSPQDMHMLNTIQFFMETPITKAVPLRNEL